MRAYQPRPVASTTVGFATGATRKSYLDLYLPRTVVPYNHSVAAALVPSLCLVPGGSGETARRGRHILVTNLNVHGVLRIDPDVTISDYSKAMARVRLIFFYDRAHNGSATGVAPQKVLALAADGVIHVSSFRNYDEASQFVLLSDKIYNLAPTAGASEFPAAPGPKFAAGMPREFRINKKVSLPIDFDDDGASPGLSNIINGNIGCLVFQEDGTALGGWSAGNGIQIEFQSRIKFVSQ